MLRDPNSEIEQVLGLFYGKVAFFWLSLCFPLSSHYGRRLSLLAFRLGCHHASGSIKIHVFLVYF